MRPIENKLNEQATAPWESAASPSQVACLFAEYAPAVRAFLLRRLGNLEDAREAAQEVFLHLWRQEQKGRLEGEARAYLFTAAENWVRDCRRRAFVRVSDRHEPIEGHTEELLAAEQDGAEVVHWCRGLEVVAACIGELPAQTQRIFSLYHGSRMNYTDIARELGITTRTVERHMAHALAHCKARLKDYL